MRGIDIAYTSYFQKELLRLAQQVAYVDIFAFYQIAVQEQLILVAGLYILGRTIDGTQIHVKQSCRPAYVEFACRNTEAFVVAVIVFLLFTTASTCYNKQHPTQGNLSRDAIDEVGQ